MQSNILKADLTATEEHFPVLKVWTKAPGHRINFMAHSMGVLDCPHLGCHLKLVKYPLLLLTVITTLTPPVTPPAIMRSAYIMCS